jgi:hypothetical protein
LICERIPRDFSQRLNAGIDVLRLSGYDVIICLLTDRSAPDTIQQFAAIFLRDNPNPFSVICVRIYPSDSLIYFAERKVDVQELIQTCATIARDAKKPLYLEAFGSRTRQNGIENPSEDAPDFMDTLVAVEASGYTSRFDLGVRPQGHALRTEEYHFRE